MAGYTRQSTFTDGDTITAALFNNEYDHLLAVFSNATGHKHDGTASEGPVIGLIGDAGETTPNNKVLIDSANNHIEFYIEVSSNPVQQLYIADGAILPVTDNDINLGSSSLEFKDLFIDGTANIDSLVADTADINGGSIDGAVIGANSAAAGTFTTVTTSSNVVVGGNLTVSGTTTTVNSNEVNIGDNIIVLNSDETGTPSQNGGIEIERGTSTNVSLLWNETNDYWTFGSNHLNFPDNSKAYFGDSNDLQIYHSSGNNFINAPVGGNLLLQANNITARSVAQEVMLNAAANGAVTLYYDNSAKLTTASGGVTITGTATATAFSGPLTGDVTGNLTGNVTGNLTGSVLTAAQTNITSLGTLSSLAVSGDLTVDTSTLKVDSSNNRVGIGTASPSRLLESNSNASDVPQIRAAYNSTNYLDIKHNLLNVVSSGGNDTLVIQTASTERMRINQAGNVGIGTSSPGARLQINGSTADTSAYALIARNSGGTSLFSIRNDGRVDIPTGNLNVTNDVAVSGNLTVTGNATINGNLTFGNAATDTVSFGADIDSNIIPDDDNTYDLGSSSQEWKDLYIDGVVYADQIDLGDNEKIRLGASQDLEIFHNGSNSVIKDGGTGNLYLQGTNLLLTDSAGYTFIECIDSGNAGTVKLYHNNAAKLATTSTGIDVTGSVVSDGLTVAGTSYIQSTTQPQLEIAYNSTNITGFYRSGGDFQIKNDNGAGTPETSIVLAEDGAVTLYYDASAKLATTSTGIDVTGSVTGDSIVADAGNNYSQVKLSGDNGTNGDSYRFTLNNDNNLLLQRSTDNFSSNSNNILSVLQSGNVGIGTTNPVDALDVNGKIRTNDRILSNWYQSTSTYGLQFSNSAGAIQVFKSDDGKLGIGTTSPSEKLHISSASPVIRLEDTTDPQTSGGSVGKIEFYGNDGSSGGAGVRSYLQTVSTNASGNDHALAIGLSGSNAAPTEKIRLTNTGLGIGTTSPSHKLDVTGSARLLSSSPQLLLQDSDGTNQFTQIIQSGGAVYLDLRNNTSNGQLIVRGKANGSATEFARIDSSGNLCLGNTGASAKLDIRQDSGTAIRCEDGSGGYFVVQHGGKVGIGTSSPAQKLHIQGSTATGMSADANTLLRLDNNANNSIQINSGTSALGQIRFGDADSNYRGALSYSHSTNAFSFTTNGLERMAINSSGNIGIGTTSPDRSLVVNHASDTRVKLQENGTDAMQLQATSSEARVSAIGGSTPLALHANGAERARIDSSGRLLIGKTAVDNATVGFRFDGASGFASIARDGGEPLYLNRKTSDGDVIKIAKNDSVVGVIGTQNWGIGTSSPSGRLTVQGAAEGDTYFTGGTANSRLLNVFTSTAGSSANAGHNFKIASGEGEFIFGNNTTANVLKIKSTGIDVTGNLGIGTTSPSAKLDIVGSKDSTNLIVSAALNTVGGGSLADYNEILFDNTQVSGASGQAYIRHLANSHNDSESAIAIGTTTTGGTTAEALRIRGSGNVGIGTSSPASLLSVSDGGNTGVEIIPQHAHNRNILFSFDRTGGGYKSLDIDALDVHFNMGGTEKVRIDSSGRVLIGTTSSLDNNSLLHIKGFSSGHAAIVMQDQDNTNAKTFFKQTGGATEIQTQNNTAHGVFKVTGWNGTASAEFMRVDGASGNVGIGTSSPSAKLEISGNGLSEKQLVIIDSDNTTGRGQFIHNGSTTSIVSQGTSGLGTVTIGGSTVGASPVYCTFNNTGVTVAGALSKGSGSFKIDHPLKPDTHHLVHSFVEGPQADNLYSGEIKLINGQAQINLDEWFGMTEGTLAALNRDFRVFTTNESDWDNVKGKIENNILTIICQNPDSSAEVSWLVIGERQDKEIHDSILTDDNGKIIIEPEKA